MAEIAVILDVMRRCGKFGSHDNYNKLTDMRLSYLELFPYQPLLYPVNFAL